MNDDQATMVLYLRRARNRARTVAAAEVAALMRGLGASIAHGGPLADRRGVAWVQLPEFCLIAARERLQHVGYCDAIDLLRPMGNAPPAARSVRWKNRDWALTAIYQEPDEALRAEAPDRREFLLECGDGVTRTIAGYRGSAGPLTHRALPVIDARMLVNLVLAPERGTLLDPFAGIGGIVIAGKACGWRVVSVDNDPALRYGLDHLADTHIVGSAAGLPIASASIDAVATEPPYHPSAIGVIVASVAEIARVLRPGARAALLISDDQARPVGEAAKAAGLHLELDERIDRKGTDVVCQCWRKPSNANPLFQRVLIPGSS